MERTDYEQGYAVPKRKRGRPPKVRYPIPHDVEFPASHLSKETIQELQLIYKPLKEIMGITKMKPLVEKPDELLYGLYDYYHTVENPMWFLEVSRKYAEGEYQSAVQVISDLRLVLENCYLFWGTKHKFCKQALRAEKIVAKHVLEFPPKLKTSCSIALFDSEEAFTPTYDANNRQQYWFTQEGNNSLILQNLIKKPQSGDSGATFEELKKWEIDVLHWNQFDRQINVMPELAEIGQFFSLAKDMMCLKHITQYEIERMLLMSRESITLATVMTSFLCPTAMRPALYFKPIMVYDVWGKLLQKKLDGWYHVYSKHKDRLQVFLKYGVEPSFFGKLGDTNPLTDSQFHELDLLKKATILKALCSNVFHSNKAIEEYFNQMDDMLLNAKHLHSDSKYNYVSLFLPEIRVYRSSRICLDIDKTIEDVHPDYFTFFSNVEAQGSDEQFSRKQKFCLLAQDSESLSNLLKTFAKKKKARITINRLLSEEKNREKGLLGLKALFNQWKRALYKDPAVKEISKNYWIVKVGSSSGVYESKKEEILSVENDESKRGELGKRILKRKFPIEVDSDSSSSVGAKPKEEDVSDWEDGNVRPIGRMKKVSRRPRFFDSKYMKLSGKQNKSSGEKKPRKRKTASEPSNLYDDFSQTTKKKNPQGVKKPNSLYTNIFNSSELLTPTGRGILDEPYSPPAKLLPSWDKYNKSSNSSHFQSNDLFDLPDWGFGVQSHLTNVPLKPVASVCLPDDGNTKLLELGAIKKSYNAPKKRLEEAKTKPPQIPRDPLALPPYSHPISFANVINPIKLPNSTISHDQLCLLEQPGNSRMMGNVIIQAPVEQVRHSNMILNQVSTKLPLNHNFIVVKADSPKVKTPLKPPQMVIPHSSFYVKRKVNLPARRLSIPIIKNHELTLFENQQWATQAQTKKVLYIPSGTPTITIPSSLSDLKDVSTWKLGLD